MNRPITNGYSVEICIELGRDKSGDMHPDLCKYEQHEFATRDEAIAAATKMLSQDAFREITITPFTRDKYGTEYDWDNREIVCDGGVVAG